MSKPICVIEWISHGGHREEKFYSYQEIRDMFDNDESILVIQLLNRAEELEKEKAELIMEAGQWAQKQQ